MEKQDILQKMTELKVKYPDIVKLVIDFYGSGDSLDGFDNMTAYMCDEDIIDISESDGYELSDINHHMIYRLGLSFDGDGAEGTITYDFLSMSVSIDSRYPVTEYETGDSLELSLIEEEDE
jgi:hypothetical protein